MRRMLLLLLLFPSLALAAGCATTQAKTRAAEAPALDPPPPPPRIIAPLDPETAIPSEPLAEEPARLNQPARSPARPPRESSTGRTEAPKVEPPKPETEAPVKPEGPPEPPPVHRLQPANEAEQESAIVNRLATAEQDLSRVDYRVLSGPLKNQYNTAKRFIAQARDALKTRNFVFADSLAQKAATIAGSLKKP